MALDAVAFVNEHAPWLSSAELGVCVVGSQALAAACRRDGVDSPTPDDIDLAWSLDCDRGRELLDQNGCFVPTTAGNLQRGTVAAKIGGRRIEITTFRTGDPSAPLQERIRADLSERDMTIGAIAVEVANGAIHDPFGGVDHYRERRVVPVGNPAERVREHGIRWLRYFRKAHEHGFSVDTSIRGLKNELDPRLLLELPKEAVALELRAAVSKTASPGRCLLDLHEAGLLATVSAPLARQFDGRQAGPQRWHPEVSQALHVILAVEWAVTHTTEMDARDRTATLFAVLCHDLGKSDTPERDLPHHRGHEGAGVPHIEALHASWPGLMDQRTATLCKHVAALHLQLRRFDEMRSGTLAKLYDVYFRAADYPLEPFAVAVAADSAGRLGFDSRGEVVRDKVLRDLNLLRNAGGSVDAAALRRKFHEDLDTFRRELHAARARAISAARSTDPRA